MILATLVLVHTMMTLAPLLMPLFIGVLLAVTLHPIIEWLENHHVPRWLAIFLLTVTLAASMITIVVALVPRMANEFSSFLDNLPELQKDLLSYLSPNNPLRPMIEQNLTRKAILPTNYDLGRFYVVGSWAFGSASELVMIFVFTIYLVVDGPRVIKWSTAFFSLTRRAKIRLTFHEVSEIIFAYAAGQFITSLLSFVVTFAALSYLKVPGALLLATLSGLFDVLPVLGFFLAVFPAMLFALRVSTETSMYVLLVYLGYHALENYLIAPYVYGNRLRISTFAVLMATLAAGFLAGIEGAISILPVVASYPVIEKIWLRRYVGEDAVNKHLQMEHEQHPEMGH
jgi:predicted PurR-regulated permease PerM